ncbi:S53 family peptidase [Burkholderia gladioli]|uniref:S53 family peptidase n=1 Tax=Burkholderia gladioli TaxID=28095 RepID=UPI00163E16EF|nr:S53 family peptidase [Burkholderia gladioli]
MSNRQSVQRRALKRFAFSLLPIAAAVLAQPAAHAADPANWVATRTQAFLLPAGASAGTATASIASTTQARTAATRYALNSAGKPALPNTQVTPLELSQPLHIAVALKNRNEAELDALLKEIEQPGSANYQKYLTPAQFKARFAPTDEQVQAVVAHLKASGFSHVEVSANNKLVTASGNASDVQNAFHASLKRFSYLGKPVYANDTPALVPAQLGATVDSVLGLQNVVTPRPQIALPPANPARNQGASANAAAPQAAAASQVAHQPTDFAKIYNAGSLPAATKTTVGIITWGDVSQAITDLNIFTRNAGLATVDTKVVAGGSGTLNPIDDNSLGEWNLDSQSIIGTSGGVKQLIFYSALNTIDDGSGVSYVASDADIAAAYDKAVSDNEAKIINVSLGADETAAGGSGALAALDSTFKQAVAQGQIFSVSSGDAGVYQWSRSPYGQPGVVGSDSNYWFDALFGSPRLTSTVDLGKYSVSTPASSPYVVAVGGTTLSTTNTTTWAGETAWNEGLRFADATSSGALDDAVRLWATGGGVSQYEPVPSWQTATLGKSVTKRALPDVSFDAASATGAILVHKGKTGYGPVGGTSLASPIFVGGFARVESAHDNSIGFPNPGFYQNLPASPTLVHDVTSGNNGYDGHGYKAGAGWDYATGHGSLDFAKLSASYK